MNGWRFRAARCLLYAVELFVLFLISETPGMMPRLLGVRPLLLLPAAMTIALLEDEWMGLAFGLFAGLLMDFGAGTVLGFYAVTLGVLCYFTGLLAVNLIRTNVLTAMLTAAVAIWAVLSLQFVFFYLLKGYADAGYAYQYRYLPLMLHAFVPTPLLYFLNKLIALGVRSRDAGI
jgi:rod shape-determining protein MreD